MKRVLTYVSLLAGNLLENPTNIVNNKVEVGDVHAQGEGVCPPTQAQNHQERAIWPTMLKIVE